MQQVHQLYSTICVMLTINVSPVDVRCSVTRIIFSYSGPNYRNFAVLNIHAGIYIFVELLLLLFKVSQHLLTTVQPKRTSDSKLTFSPDRAKKLSIVQFLCRHSSSAHALTRRQKILLTRNLITTISDSFTFFYE